VKPITIIGGGLAGLSLGIGLRQRGVPVTIFEAGHYPRHRVCGEFISGRGIESLEQLGLLEMVKNLGGMVARDAAFFTSLGMLGRRRLPTPALCISRVKLDAALAKRFCELEGTLKVGERWSEASPGEGTVVASGRRRAAESSLRWFGLKVHARHVRMEADLEIHWHRGWYVGLCRLHGGAVNICGLFGRRRDNEMSADILTRLHGESGSVLERRLAGADFDLGSSCSVAGLSFRSEPIAGHECRLGDALTMIPPITGNGMSMALESATCALSPLLRYANGWQEWLETTEEISRRLSGRFRQRMFWARLLHRTMFSRGEPLTRLALLATPLWRAAFSLTR
jgi:2-polyprenyl-6-methoxyphenol hydroxylase-like FAD-dependent oxidoreductase